jgi:hypothetical protein
VVGTGPSCLSEENVWEGRPCRGRQEADNSSMGPGSCASNQCRYHPRSSAGASQGRVGAGRRSSREAPLGGMSGDRRTCCTRPALAWPSGGRPLFSPRRAAPPRPGALRALDRLQLCRRALALRKPPTLHAYFRRIAFRRLSFALSIEFPWGYGSVRYTLPATALPIYTPKHTVAM